MFVAAVGEAMTEMCGEVADGLLAHAFTTKRYSEEVTTPALLRGMRAVRPQARRLRGVLPGVRGDRRRRGRRWPPAAVGTRKQIAFYASTPAYRKVLDLHGWGDLQTDLHRLSHAGDGTRWASLIDDEILDEFAVVAPVHEVAKKVRERCDGVIDRVLVGVPRQSIERRSSTGRRRVVRTR